MAKIRKTITTEEEIHEFAHEIAEENHWHVSRVYVIAVKYLKVLFGSGKGNLSDVMKTIRGENEK